MKEPIPHTQGLQAYLAAASNAQNTLANRDAFIAQSAAGVRDSLAMFEAYKELNHAKAKQEAQEARQIQLENMQKQLLQKDIDNYDKKLDASIHASHAQANAANASASQIYQAVQELRKLENMRYNNLKKLQPKPQPPEPQKLDPTPKQKTPTAIVGNTTNGSPLS